MGWGKGGANVMMAKVRGTKIIQYVILLGFNAERFIIQGAIVAHVNLLKLGGSGDIPL